MIRIILIASIFLLTSTSLFGQEYGKYKIGKPFNTVFRTIHEGKFEGTINGVLLITDHDSNRFILDFQAGKSSLTMIPDSLEVYDKSTKVYQGSTTSGKTKIKYSTYSLANRLIISLSTGDYQAGSLDGAADMVISGINYQYEAEKGTEYLILSTDKDIEMNNFWWLRSQGKLPKDAHRLKKTITLRANSSIVFAIKRY